MTAKPYDDGAVYHLNWALFRGSFNVFVYFAGARGSDSPSGDAFEIAGHDEPPAGQQAVPGCDLDGNAVLNAFERVVNAPVVLGVVRLGRCTWPMGFRCVVVGHLIAVVFWTLGQRSVPD